MERFLFGPENKKSVIPVQIVFDILLITNKYTSY